MLLKKIITAFVICNINRFCFKKYYLQVFLEECKYVVKENKIRKFIMMMADWMVADWTVSMYFKNRCVKHAHSSQTFQNNA